ncbi:MAG: secretion system protein [Wolbachia endosymbiont of Tyrophagus putrescentiae]|nr:secretion system protein [Wolbachia endosymbiont of Tyrophagus putrescentiae]
MAILKFLVLFIIISCTHISTKPHDDFHVRESHALLQQYQEVTPPSEPGVLHLPVKFPDITNNSLLISINVNESTPVKDLLIEIGKISDINLDIDPKISGNIILKLKDKSVSEVIQNIAQSAGLRYSMDNDVVRIERDLPYVKNYYADFINIQRSAQSNFIISDDIINNKGNITNEASNNVMRSQYSSDLWASLEKGLNTIMDVNGTNDDEFLSSNKETGVIILSARKDTHKAVEEYINKVKRLASSQVMIEAKVVEVVLNDRYLAGINLNDLNNSQAGCPSTSSLVSLVKSLDKFGTSTVISSTRIHAANNQQAMISFAKNHVYFTIDAQKSTNRNLITKINSVPIGVVLVIHPSINVDTNEVFMDIHPTLSRINGYAKDPGIELIAQKNKTKLNSNIPLVEIREINSMLKVKSGEIMVIGGLIEHREDKYQSKKTKLHKKPKNKIKTIETVVFLKATIIPTFGLLNTKDKHLYMLN